MTKVPKFNWKARALKVHARLKCDYEQLNADISTLGDLIRKGSDTKELPGKSKADRVCKLIRGHREARRWTAGYLASRASVSVNHYSLLETGGTGLPSESMLKRISQAFGISVRELTTEEAGDMGFRTVKEAEAILCVPTNMLYSLRKAGKGPKSLIRGRIVYKESELLDWKSKGGRNERAQ